MPLTRPELSEQAALFYSVSFMMPCCSAFVCVVPGGGSAGWMLAVLASTEPRMVISSWFRGSRSPFVQDASLTVCCYAAGPRWRVSGGPWLRALIESARFQ